MSVHVLIDIKVKDKNLYEEYLQKVVPIVKKFGGHYLLRGGKITPLSGNWRPERLILIEFDNIDRVNQWLKSPEYGEVAYLRENSTVSNAVIIESGVIP